MIEIYQGKKKTKPKYKMLAELVERRIYHGDYSLKPLPSERELALETSVASGTARRALKHLINKGVLELKENGRLALCQNSSKNEKTMRIAFLAPAFPSNDIANWQLAIAKACERYNASVRPVYYVHWNDVIIQDALEGFDGIFLYPHLGANERVIEMFRRAKSPLVVVDSDWSDYQIPSVSKCIPECAYEMLDYLESLGHRHIDCLNVNLLVPTIESRIQKWNLWKTVHRYNGELINEPVRPFEWGIERARIAVKNRIESGNLKATALFCTAEHAAIGAMSACAECGLEVGKDISICEMNDEGLAKYLNPTLTSFEITDSTAYLSVCLDWMKGGGKDWTGPLLVKPKQMHIFKGRSTGPAPV